jgi:signal transduction histidine kinase
MKFYAWIIILIAMTTSGVSAWLIVLNQKRQQAEERAKHEKELEMMHSEKLASLERLTSGIASEIGNPLTSVSSFVQILTGMEEDEFKRETLETTSFHVNRISDILKQLSGFSKMTPSELKPCIRTASSRIPFPSFSMTNAFRVSLWCGISSPCRRSPRTATSFPRQW